MKRIAFSIVPIVCLSNFLLSCDSVDKYIADDPSRIVQLELFDSLLIDQLSPMHLHDLNLDFGLALLMDKEKQLYLTDLKGNIQQNYNLVNDGPEGVGEMGAQGYKFLDDSHFIAQGFLNGYFLYDLQGKLIQKTPHNTENLFRLMIYRGRTTFHPFFKDGEVYVLGEEPNFFSDDDMDPKKHGAGIYEKISAVFRYNLKKAENELLETFPPTWEPRANQRYVGNKFAFVAMHDSKKSYALLPLSGSQLFIYNMDAEVSLQNEISLHHPQRPDLAPNMSFEAPNEFDDYPVFSNLLYAGDYCLVQFHTKIPEAKMKSFRAKSEQYYSLPEYKEALKTYVKPYFILVKNGHQIGIINDLPVNGTVEFLDKNGTLYINDNTNPKVERDYNVFYKLRIVE